MNREIKFRAWNQAQKTMYYNHSVSIELGGEVLFLFPDGEWKQISSEAMALMQFTGLHDKNGKEIYEGDVVKWVRLEIEWQTHTGDNIPLGSYTEPCGIISKNIVKPVLFHNGEFTILEPDGEDHEYNWLRHFSILERKEINYIFFPHYDENRSQQYSDEDFIEVMNDVAKALKINPQNIDEFISMVNGIEVIGNIYEHPQLLTPTPGGVNDKN